MKALTIDVLCFFALPSICSFVLVLRGFLFFSLLVLGAVVSFAALYRGGEGGGASNDSVCSCSHVLCPSAYLRVACTMALNCWRRHVRMNKHHFSELQ